jgi:hypothetical protein
MHTATKSSPIYTPILKDLQSAGYADWYAEFNERHSKDNRFSSVAPTTEEMESAYSAASHVDDDGQRLMRGVTYHVDVSSSSIRHKPIAFRPDANGEEFYVWPVKEDCRIIDFIWSTTNFDDWGFTTGRGAVLGAENLSKTYTAELPLHVYDNPHSYWERTDDEEEDPTTREDAVCILKPSARALLPAVGHVQVFYWDDVEDLAEGYFTDYPDRVSAFQDQEAFDAYVKRAARWDRFDYLKAPTPPAGTRLTWAHAKAAIKARRKVNAETGLDGCEENRARVKAVADRPEVVGAIEVYRNDPTDANRLLTIKACSPFHLDHIAIARMTKITPFSEWLRRRESGGGATGSPEPGGGAADDEPEAKPDVGAIECMFQRIGCLVAKPRDYLIRGLIARNEVCNPFGRPDSFKGVAASQLVVHIAGGIDFLGLEVKKAPTAYFAGERGEQVKRRIKGHIQRLGLPHDLPCYFGGKPINLLSKPDLDFLVANIKAIESDAGSPLGFLAIDTQSRTFGGDENSTADGAAYAKAIEAIRAATKATLWIIAHTGHSEDAQDRPRGSSALLGAYDTFYRHKKIDERRGEIKITIDRDGLGGKEFPFAVELYDTGALNEDGEPVLVPYLEAAAAPVKFTFKKGDEPRPGAATDMEREALRALEKAIKNHGLITPEGDGGPTPDGESIPPGEVTVCFSEWQAAFYKLDRERNSTASRQAFNRSSKALVKKKLVGTWNNRRWPL